MSCLRLQDPFSGGILACKSALWESQSIASSVNVHALCPCLRPRNGRFPLRHSLPPHPTISVRTNRVYLPFSLRAGWENTQRMPLFLTNPISCGACLPTMSRTSIHKALENHQTPLGHQSHGGPLLDKSEAAVCGS